MYGVQPAGAMASSSNTLLCDGCGQPASPEHIAQRLRRLELSTRFRPVHIGVLFIALAPVPRPEDDFYGPPESKEFFNHLLDAVQIPVHPSQAGQESDAAAIASARLLGFQRRGYYLAYLSECPITGAEEPVATTISRLAPTLVRRIRLNYKPKQIATLGPELAPLAEVLNGPGIGSILTLDQGTALSAHGI
jgi:hypothetical protein